MTDFLLFALATIGLTHIMVDSDMPLVAWLRKVGMWILEKIPPQKHWQKVLTCYQCCGTWVGFFAGWALLTKDPFGIFLSGCAGGFLAQWGGYYLDALQAQCIVAGLDDPIPPPPPGDSNG